MNMWWNLDDSWCFFSFLALWHHRREKLGHQRGELRGRCKWSQVLTLSNPVQFPSWSTDIPLIFDYSPMKHRNIHVPFIILIIVSCSIVFHNKVHYILQYLIRNILSISQYINIAFHSYFIHISFIFPRISHDIPQWQAQQPAVTSPSARCSNSWLLETGLEAGPLLLPTAGKMAPFF